MQLDVWICEFDFGVSHHGGAVLSRAPAKVTPVSKPRLFGAVRGRVCARIPTAIHKHPVEYRSDWVLYVTPPRLYPFSYRGEQRRSEKITGSLCVRVALFSICFFLFQLGHLLRSSPSVTLEVHHNDQQNWRRVVKGVYRSDCAQH